jgi:hypothetical protein
MKRSFTDRKMNGFFNAVQTGLDETPKNLTEIQFFDMMQGMKKLTPMKEPDA